MRTFVMLLAMAVAASLGIECAKGNLEWPSFSTHLPAVLKRQEGRNCPLYYLDKE